MLGDPIAAWLEQDDEQASGIMEVSVISGRTRSFSLPMDEADEE